MKKLIPVIGAGAIVASTTVFGGYAQASITEEKVKEVNIENAEQTSGEDSVVDHNLPYINYMVVGGSPTDVKFERKDTVNKYMNLGETEVEVEGLTEVEDLGATYKDIESSVKLGSVISLGNVGLYGEPTTELTLGSEDFINLKPVGAVEEYVMEYNKEDKEYKLLGKYSETDLTLKEVADKDLSIVAFINDFQEEEEALAKAEEAKKEEESKSESEEDKEEETVEESEESDESDKSEKEEDSEESEEEEEPKLERGNADFMGQPIVVEENNGDGVLILTPNQFSALVEDADKPYTEKRIYKDAEVTNEEEVFTKLGLFNISEDMQMLFDKGLDTDKDGVIYSLEDEPMIKHLVIEEDPAVVEYDENATIESDDGETGADWEGELDEDPNAVDPEDSDYEEGNGMEGGVVEEDNGDGWEDMPGTGDNQGSGEEEEVSMDDDLPESESEGGEVVEEGNASDYDDEGNYIGEEIVYDEDGNEVSDDVEDNGSESEVETEDIEFIYEYDEEGNLVSIVDKDGNVIAQRDAEGNMVYSDSVEDTDNVEEAIGITETSQGKVNEEGYLVDSTGNYVNESGERVSEGVLPDTGIEQSRIATILAVVLGVAGATLMFFRKPKGETLIDTSSIDKEKEDKDKEK